MSLVYQFFWNTVYKKSQKRYISPIRGEAPCEQIVTKFCTFGDMPDVIICANFGVEKLRGLGNTGVKFWALPLKRLVTFTTVLRYRTAGDSRTAEVKKIADRLDSTIRNILAYAIGVQFMPITFRCVHGRVVISLSGM